MTPDTRVTVLIGYLMKVMVMVLTTAAATMPHNGRTLYIGSFKALLTVVVEHGCCKDITCRGVHNGACFPSRYPSVVHSHVYISYPLLTAMTASLCPSCVHLRLPATA